MGIWVTQERIPHGARWVLGSARRGYHTQSSLEAIPDKRTGRPQSKAAASSTRASSTTLCTGSLCKGTRDQRLVPRQG